MRRVEEKSIANAAVDDSQLNMLSREAISPLIEYHNILVRVAFRKEDDG